MNFLTEADVSRIAEAVLAQCLDFGYLSGVQPGYAAQLACVIARTSEAMGEDEYYAEVAKRIDLAVDSFPERTSRPRRSRASATPMEAAE